MAVRKRELNPRPNPPALCSSVLTARTVSNPVLADGNGNYAYDGRRGYGYGAGMNGGYGGYGSMYGMNRDGAAYDAEYRRMRRGDWW